MNRQEASEQINSFALRVGVRRPETDSAKPLQMRLGESVVGFEFDAESESIISRALVYRFRKAPAENALSAIMSLGGPENTGGGQLTFDSQTTTLFIERRFAERLDDAAFYDDINRLAQASILWSTKLLADAAEQSAGG
jgi:hypothetical protein